MAYINFQPRDFFNTVLYTGTGANDTAITGVGFQPDWTWIKKRSSTSQHVLTDSSRGVTKQVFSSTSQVEQTATDFITSFDIDGFTLGDNADGTKTGDVNVTNGATYVSWNWLANGGTTSSNTDGSITSTVQANTTAGFSIVQYVGTGSAGTVGHGLGVTPRMVIVKNRDVATGWWVMHKDLNTNYNLQLQATNAQLGTGDYTGGVVGTGTTSTTFPLVAGTTASNVSNSGSNYIAYCFANIEGYSNFGSYTGNGSTDGTFVYTGFRPAWVMVKRTDTTADWHIDDATRNTFNPTDARLDPNSNAAESSSIIMHDFTSNGFKTRTTSADWNASGGTYIYMAFAEFPLVGSNGLAGTAR